MKTLLDSPAMLVLDQTLWLPSLIAIVLMLVALYAGVSMIANGQSDGWAFVIGGGGMGIALLAIFARRTRITFDRTAGTVTRRVRSLFGTREERWPLDEIADAVLRRSRDGNGRNSWSAALRFRTGGEKGLTMIGTGRNGPERAVTNINTWLGNSLPG